MQVLHELPVAAGPVLLDKYIQAMCGISAIRLQPEDAAALWLLTGMSREQWTCLASVDHGLFYMFSSYLLLRSRHVKAYAIRTATVCFVLYISDLCTSR
jgi:hypothetical protein